MKTLSARGDQKLLIAYLPFLGDDETLLGIHTLHCLTE